MAKVLETEIQKRFSDVDPFQHVNNVSQQMYFDVGKMEYYEQVLGDEVLLGDLRIITVSTSTSYMGQIRLHDRVRVTTTCEKIGNKSLTLFQQLVVDGQVRSESRSVMVAFDFARQLSMPVPEAWRTRRTKCAAARRAPRAGARGGHSIYTRSPPGRPPRR
jgi:acyl-CoA thioester hydrolase